MKATPGEWRDEPEEYGVITGPATVRIERLLSGPIERVWEYLTDSEKRGKWFASGPMELRPGGRIEFEFHNSYLSAEREPTPERFKKCDGGERSYGEVIQCEPPNLLSFKWTESGDEYEVTFELKPRDEKVFLVLTHERLKDRTAMVSVAGGWHAHIGILVDILNGRQAKPFWSTYERLEAAYDERFPRD